MEIPTLALGRLICPWMSTGMAMLPSTRCAVCTACSVVQLDSSSTNSSPDRRPMQSLGAHAFAQALRHHPQQVSPAAWPWVSLTCLNRSEVHEEQGAGLVVTRHAGQGPFRAVAEHGAVGQAGEYVKNASWWMRWREASRSMARAHRCRQTCTRLLCSALGSRGSAEIKRERAHHQPLVVLMGLDQQALSPVDSKRAR